MSNTIYGWLAAAAVLALSCGSGAAEAVNASKVIDPIRYEVSAMPLEAYKRGRDPAWQPSSAAPDYLYVSLKLRHEEGGVDLIKWGCTDYEEYNRRLHFFNNGIREHVYLSTGESKYYPLESVYENGYGISPLINVVMVFKKPAAQGGSPVRLVFEDKIYTQQIVKFSLK